MKPVHEKNAVAHFGSTENEKRSFSVKIDAHIFKTLVSSIYARKEEAVVREILANAFDAHIAAGCADVAVEVSLPSYFKNVFRVRDYGIGMSHEFVLDLYTKLGHSEKQGDNNQTGMFGYGAKSPFSVTDQFTINVYDGKVKRVYLAHIAEDGIPALQAMPAISSSEPRGTEIVVPVANSAADAFDDAVRFCALAYFDKPIKFSRPLKNGEEALKYADGITTKIGDNVYLVSQRSERNNSTLFLVRQGFAVYPLQLNTNADINARISADLKTWERLLRNHSDMSILIDVPIGSCGVTASREDLQFTDTTCASIVAALAPVAGLLSDKVQNLVKDVWNFQQLDALVDKMATGTAAQQRAATGGFAIGGSTSEWKRIFEKHVVTNYHALSAAKALNPDRGEPKRAFDLKLPTGTVHCNVRVGKNRKGVLDIDGRPTYNNDDTVSVTPRGYICILPVGLKFWRQRLVATCAAKGAANVNDYYGLQTQVIVVPDPKLIPDLVEKAKAHYVTEKIWTEADLEAYAPPTIGGSPLAGTYSMNDVAVLWDGNGNFDMTSARTRVDLSKPAYYMMVESVRHTDASFYTEADDPSHDALGSVPGAAPSKPPGYNAGSPRATIRVSSIKDMLTAGHRAGIIDPNIPVYRLTKAQTARLPMANKNLEHLPSKLVEACRKHAEATYTANGQALFNWSDVCASRHPLHVFVSEIVKEVTTPSALTSRRAVLLGNAKALQTWAKSDALVLHFVPMVLTSDINSKATTLPQALLELFNLIFINAPSRAQGNDYADRYNRAKDAGPLRLSGLFNAIRYDSGSCFDVIKFLLNSIASNGTVSNMPIPAEFTKPVADTRATIDSWVNTLSNPPKP